MLGKALRDAEIDGLVIKNVCKTQKAPKITETEMTVVRNVPAFISAVRGSTERYYVPVMVALFTGMRLSEILALRWNRVDLEAKVLQVREALEQTRAYGVRFKAPKSGPEGATSHCQIFCSMRCGIIARPRLSCESRSALEGFLRMRCCSQILMARPLYPSGVSARWTEIADRIGMPEVTFHSLRHTTPATWSMPVWISVPSASASVTPNPI